MATKINANSIREGNVLHHKGNLWLVLKKEHTMPGKGGAFIQAEMKDIVNGTKLNERFRSSEDVEKAFLEDKKFQYQYSDGQEMSLMDMTSFEQISLPLELLGDARAFLQDNMEVTIQFCEEKPILASLPEHAVFEVVEADPVVKGQTAAASYKPAMLENGSRISVPPFITSGDKVVIKTSDGAYVKRAE